MSTPTPWSRFSMPHQYAPSTTGAPLAGAKLYFFVSETSEPLDTYSDATLSTPNENPVVATPDGLFGDIFLAQQSYRVKLVDANEDEIWTADPVAPFVPVTSTQLQTVVIQVTVDGNKQALTAGVCGDEPYIPFDCTITKAVISADQPGNLVLDVWAAPFVTNSPPTAVNSITASDPVTLSSEQSSIDTVLTGWNKTITAGTTLRYNIESVDTITRFTLNLTATISVPAS